MGRPFFATASGSNDNLSAPSFLILPTPKMDSK